MSHHLNRNIESKVNKKSMQMHQSKCLRSLLHAYRTLSYVHFFYCRESSFISSCNSNCDCSTAGYEPVCDQNQIVYFSPCHAGCSGVSDVNGTKVLVQFSMAVVKLLHLFNSLRRRTRKLFELVSNPFVHDVYNKIMVC